MCDRQSPPTPPSVQGYVAKATASIRRQLVTSTSNLKAQRKSAPRIGVDGDGDGVGDKQQPSVTASTHSC